MDKLNQINYPMVSLAAAILSIILAACLVFVPELIYWIFGIHGNEVADLMSKRAAALFIGLSIIAFKSRNECNSPLRQTLALAFAITMLLLACFGIFEFINNRVGAGIWLAIMTELIFAALYFKFWYMSDTKE